MKVKLLLLLATAVFASTSTVTTFTPEVDKGGDEYGNKKYSRVVSIDTKNFKVDNFFGKFSNKGNSNYGSITKKASFLITVEANSICANDLGLEEEGCSGQKPFLMKQSFVDTMNDGDVYEVPFAKAGQFSSQDNSFFALDVNRDIGYTPNEEEPPAGKKSFFQAIKDMFSNHYSADVDFFGTNLTDDEKASRDRYIANIVAGLQKDKRLTKKINEDTQNTPINQTINTPVSKLEYESMMASQKTACKGTFITRDPDSLFCRMVSGFDMASWMPFFSETNEISTETSSVMVDTETSLLTVVGNLNGVNVFNDMKDDLDGKTSFFGEILKPITNMFSTMMSFFFGTRDDAKAITVSNHYDFTKYEKQLTMTVATTVNGSEVNDFTNFTLVGLDSVYGTEVSKCVIDAPWFASDITVTSLSSNDVSFKIDNGGLFSESIYENKYDELDFYDKFAWCGFMPCKKVYFETTRDDMLSWCARRQAHNSKGIIGRIVDMFSVSSLLTWKKTKEEQIDTLMNAEHFDVKSYIEKSHRGLILHLKKEDLSTNNPANKISLKYIKSVK